MAATNPGEVLSPFGGRGSPSSSQTSGEAAWRQSYSEWIPPPTMSEESRTMAILLAIENLDMPR